MSIFLARLCCKTRRSRPDADFKRMQAGNGNLYPFLGCLSFVAFILYMFFGDLAFHPEERPKMSFVGRNEAQFILNGRAFYVNGWNSYWLMDQSVEESSRPRVSAMFKAASKMGLTVCRTWAFNDGSHNALQVSLGRFDERVFKALDQVIVEAQRHGIRLILSLVNNLEAFGGKSQYVKWAFDDGIGLSPSNDSFFFDPAIRSYFKIYVKAVLTRKNHLNGIEYRDDPTIFSWELMNEPQCIADASGDTLQDWIEEMAGYVKSIDRKHLLTVGLEGFYGPKSPAKKLDVNPGQWYGTTGSDFLRNFNISDIDFASVHIYPDQWLMESALEEKMEYISKWVSSHIEDGDEELRKPVLFTEFGLSNKNKGFDHSHRDIFYRYIFNIIYNSARKNGAAAGALIWQLLVEGMDEYNDDFGIKLGERPSIDQLIKEQSRRLSALSFRHDFVKRSSREI